MYFCRVQQTKEITKRYSKVVACETHNVAVSKDNKSSSLVSSSRRPSRIERVGSLSRCQFVIPLNCLVKRNLIIIDLY